MDNQKIKVSVFVAGQRFNIITEKSEKYVRNIADGIDARINSLVLSQGMSRERAAVLTALDYADDNELDKENIVAVKEQMKDYLREIERLQDNNAKLISDYGNLKEEYERLIGEKKTAEDAQKALADSQEKIDELQNQVDSLHKQLAAVKNEAEKAQQPIEEEPEEVPLPEEPEAEEEKKITAEDDLFFDEPEQEEAQVKPEKKKKNRHNHSHVNPYQQKAKQKDQGYTQQRQYSFFDINEE